MQRKFLVVGDSPIDGGAILEYQGPSFRILGQRAALIGGRAYCEGCNSIGAIAKTGGPRRLRFISEIALEGDVVLCRCPVPQPLVSRLQATSTYDDGEWSDASNLTGNSLPMPLGSTDSSATAFKKVVDETVVHPIGAEISESFCQNMTNKEFCMLMLKLRDRALALISTKRLPELARWDKQARSRVVEWFGTEDESLRRHLQIGLEACATILSGLTCANFVRYSAISGRKLVCTFPSESAAGTVAAVCKPDTATHTIAFTPEFCELREFSAESDSKLLTLIHEVTHFDDCFASTDTVYRMKESRRVSFSRATEMRSNADSLAGYVVWGESYGD